MVQRLFQLFWVTFRSTFNWWCHHHQLSRVWSSPIFQLQIHKPHLSLMNLIMTSQQFDQQQQKQIERVIKRQGIKNPRKWKVKNSLIFLDNCFMSDIEMNESFSIIVKRTSKWFIPLSWTIVSMTIQNGFKQLEVWVKRTKIRRSQ